MGQRLLPGFPRQMCFRPSHGQMEMGSPTPGNQVSHTDLATLAHWPQKHLLFKLVGTAKLWTARPGPAHTVGGEPWDTSSLEETGHRGKWGQLQKPLFFPSHGSPVGVLAQAPVPLSLLLWDGV